jgi:hypothetical protein
MSNVGLNIPNVSLTISNVGLNIPNVGLTISNVGVTIPNVGVTIPNVGVTVPNVGLNIPNVGLTIPNVGLTIPNVGLCSWTGQNKTLSFSLYRSDGGTATSSVLSADKSRFDSRKWQQISDRFWGSPSFLFNEYRGSFPGVKRTGSEADHSPSSTAEVKDEICGLLGYYTDFINIGAEASNRG